MLAAFRNLACRVVAAGVWRRCALASLMWLGLCLLQIHPTLAAAYSAYTWADADLALLYPAGWAQPVASADGDTLTLTLDGGEAKITLAVLPVTANDSTLRAALDAQIAAVGLLPLRYDLGPLYGRGGLRAEAVSADRRFVGAARSGRMPDDRGLVLAGRAPQANADALAADLALVLNSLVFGAGVAPVTPTYSPLWTVDAGNVMSLALAGDRLYALTGEGVQVFDSGTGARAADYPFDHPAQPTSLVVDGQRDVYAGDTVCRCLRVLNPAGRWIDPLGSFGAGAPFSLALSGDGTIYAVDKLDSGYALRVLGAPSSRTIGLNFNASASPLVTVDAHGQVWVVEWLASLIDGSTAGAVSLLSGAKPELSLQFWLPGLTPDVVTGMTTDTQGNLVFATKHGVLVVNTAGEVVDQPAQAARALAVGSEGTFYAARDDGTVSALSAGAPPDRFGASSLALGVPVGGVLAENAPQQDSTYTGKAGERVTFSAVDQTRQDAYTVDLDMALRLIAPDGTEVAYNDDQQGADLFGIYDAQIPDIALPQDGTYTVRVEWRQGQGTYVLGVSAEQPLPAPGDDGVIRLGGRLQDVFPVQRWAFAGRRGDVLTLTLSSAEGGALDPALALYQPDGRLLAYNDDASDAVLETSAQLAQVSLPADGTYTIAATRYEGAGRYSLTIVNTG